MNMEFFNHCVNNRLAEARALAGDVDLGFVDGGGRTALAMSAGRGHLEVVNWLISLNSPLETKDGDGRTALARAAVSGHIAVMEALLAAGADIDAKNKSERTVLVDALAEKQEEAGLFLIEKGAALDEADRFGRTALHHAAIHGFAKIINALVAKGARTDIADNYKMTALDCAKKERKNEVATILEAVAAQTPQAPQTPPPQASPPQAPQAPPPQAPQAPPPPKAVVVAKEELPSFIEAIRKGDADLVRDYIENGEDINQIFVSELRSNATRFTSMLGLAIEYGRAEVAALLIDAGVDINEELLNDPDFFEEANAILLEDGIDINARFYKIGEIHENLIAAYKSRGLSLDERLRNPNPGATYETDHLYEAIDRQQTEIVKKLIAAGFEYSGSRHLS
ncbi:MAG: ankyrin repeat domain-containing protein, partial [Clostridiales bacterium]|nr:ankyrin repeat domain-containing protein [Clostridiales bacterium]